MVTEINEYKLVERAFEIQEEAIEEALLEVCKKINNTHGVLQNKLEAYNKLLSTKAYSNFQSKLLKEFPLDNDRSIVNLIINSKKLEFSSSSLQTRLIEAMNLYH